MKSSSGVKRKWGEALSSVGDKITGGADEGEDEGDGTSSSVLLLDLIILMVWMGTRHLRKLEPLASIYWHLFFTALH